MGKSELTLLIVGVALGMALIPSLVVLLRAVTVQVNEREAVLITRRGKLVRALEDAGLHFVPSKLLPRVEARRVSLRLDCVHIESPEVAADLWIEFRVADPARATFAAARREDSPEGLVAQAVKAVVGRDDQARRSDDRLALGRRFERDLQSEASRWGIMIERVLVNGVRRDAPARSLH